MIESIITCALLFGAVGLSPERQARRATVCLDVAQAATAAGLDPTLLVAVGWVESGMTRGAVSRAGAVGPLQVLPQYFCPHRRAKGCDLIDAGVRAFLAWRKIHPKPRATLCHYNGGNLCTKGGQRYARRVLRLAQRIRLEVRK